MPEFDTDAASRATTDHARGDRRDDRREHVSPTVESLGTWQAVTLVSSLLRVTREF